VKVDTANTLTRRQKDRRNLMARLRRMAERDRNREQAEIRRKYQSPIFEIEGLSFFNDGRLEVSAASYAESGETNLEPHEALSLAHALNQWAIEHIKTASA
jgi:hypothetical protein